MHSRLTVVALSPTAHQIATTSMQLWVPTVDTVLTMLAGTTAATVVAAAVTAVDIAACLPAAAAAETSCAVYPWPLGVSAYTSDMVTNTLSTRHTMIQHMRPPWCTCGRSNPV